MEELSSLTKYSDKVMSMAVEYAPKIALAIIVYVIGSWVIKMLMKGMSALLKKKSIDESLTLFLTSLVRLLLKFLLILTVIDMIGVETTSFIALLGAAGLAVGMALQGSLSNFAGGVLILFFKPFKVGDYIIAQGEEGTVQRIDVLNTWLNKLDNRRVILPNGPLASGTIVNVTAEKVRRVDLTVGIGYGESINKAKQVLVDAAAKDSRILKDPAPFVGVTDFGDSSVNLTFRVWCNNEDYWGVFFDTNEVIKSALDEAKIEIPFPQRDVHMITK